ncbi:MAG: hypothetical protein ACRDKE_06430 [Solirubrobacterales bacterium]
MEESDPMRGVDGWGVVVSAIPEVGQLRHAVHDLQISGVQSWNQAFTSSVQMYRVAYDSVPISDDALAAWFAKSAGERGLKPSETVEWPNFHLKKRRGRGNKPALVPAGPTQELGWKFERGTLGPHGFRPASILPDGRYITTVDSSDGHVSYASTRLSGIALAGMAELLGLPDVFSG